MVDKTKKDWGKVREVLEDDLVDDSAMGDHDADQETHGALDHPAYAELEQQLTLAEQKAHEIWE